MQTSTIAFLAGLLQCIFGCHILTEFAAKRFDSQSYEACFEQVSDAWNDMVLIIAMQMKNDNCMPIQYWLLFLVIALAYGDMRIFI